MNNHKAIVRQFYDAIWNNADTTIIPELLCEDFAFRGSLGQQQRGHAGFAQFMAFIRAALGNYRCEIIDMVAEDDKVYARILYTGIHRGELFGYAPTNAKLKWDGIAAFTFRDGRIAELWVLGDLHSVMKQLSRHVAD